MRFIYITLVSLTLIGCGTIDAPVIIGINSATSPACTSPANAAASTVAFSDKSIANQLPSPVASTGPMVKYISQLEAAKTMSNKATTVMAASPGNQRRGSVEITETMMGITQSEFENFLKEFNSHVLNVGNMSGPSKDAFVTLGAQEPRLMRLYRFYLITYSHGKYIDRRGTKYEAPDISDGLSNKVLTTTLAIFLDAIADWKFTEPVLTDADGKKYYPSGKTDAPTVLSADKAGLIVVKTAKIVEDTMQCGLTEKEAQALSVLGALAEKKSALASGVAAEAISGWDISFVVGGRFAVGDNKTLEELIKTFFAISARRASEHTAYSFFNDFAYTEASIPEFLFDVGFALGDQ